MYIAGTGSDSVSAAKPQNQGSGGSGTEGTVEHQGSGQRTGAWSYPGRTLVAPGSLGRRDR
jgi:hypothetical protein